METVNILHITDLHLNNPSDLNEKLRRGFFKDYINLLFNLIEARLSLQVDYVVCTGDIVNRGIVQNFDHANNIFKFISQRGKISDENLFITIGNHDLIVQTDDEGDNSRFKKFVQENTKRCDIEEKLFSVRIIHDKKICFCLLDSIFNQDGKIFANSVTKTIYPSTLSDQTIDFIVNEVDDAVPSDYLLIVACHFPMAISPDGEMYTENPGWVDKHLWKSGKTIAKRLIARRSSSNTFFLFGDGHLPDFWAYSNNIQFFMTGMFGGDFINITYKNAAGEDEAFNKTNQAKLLRFKPDNSIYSVTTFNYSPEGMQRSPQTGIWEMVDSSKPRIQKSDIELPIEKSFEQSKVEELNIKNKPAQEPTILNLGNSIELIASHIQNDIINEIKTRSLYTVARTSSSNNESSLGWLPINQLFLKTELLIRCVDRAFDWLNERVNNCLDYNNSIIIGIGFWGSIIASQISLRIGIRNFGISSNLSGAKNSNYESLENLCKYIAANNSIMKIIVVTDVISTGNSIIKVKKTIEDKCGLREYWAAISVVGDKKQKRTAAINEYQLLGSFCIDLPIPVISNEFLPEESIFPIEYDYR